MKNFEEPIYRGDCMKRGTWTVCRFRDSLGKKEEGGCFWEGLIPQCTLWLKNILIVYSFISSILTSNKIYTFVYMQHIFQNPRTKENFQEQSFFLYKNSFSNLFTYLKHLLSYLSRLFYSIINLVNACHLSPFEYKCMTVKNCTNVVDFHGHCLRSHFIG